MSGGTGTRNAGAQARRLDREVTRLVDAYQAEVIELNELAERADGLKTQGRMLRTGCGKSPNTHRADCRTRPRRVDTFLCQCPGL